MTVTKRPAHDWGKLDGILVCSKCGIPGGLGIPVPPYCDEQLLRERAKSAGNVQGA